MFGDGISLRIVSSSCGSSPRRRSPPSVARARLTGTPTRIRSASWRNIAVTSRRGTRRPPGSMAGPELRASFTSTGMSCMRSSASMAWRSLSALRVPTTRLPSAAARAT
jgi:hypothetical protein